MRQLTNEEVEILKKIGDKNLATQEKAEMISRLKEIEMKETNGMNWLT